MMRSVQCVLIFFAGIFMFSCQKSEEKKGNQPVHKDVPFQQEFSIKYTPEDENLVLRRVYADRNGVVQVLSSNGLLKLFAGEFLYPGKLVSERTYRPIADKKVNGIALYKNQFVYADDEAVLSNAWAGNLYAKHTLPKASMLEGGNDFDFLISDGQSIQYLKDSTVQWTGEIPAQLLDIRFDEGRNVFWLLTSESVQVFSPSEKSLTPAVSGSSFTCMSLANDNKDLIIGTGDGYLVMNAETKISGEPVKKLPFTEITTVEEIDGKMWFGTTKGAFTTK
ncbi:MAG TPA: hypothetical protein VFW11_19740, partial [Cyclobacteriaceae bacterium]|nr:hypothetical protein [Cyclobacteriaceae bacterium]